MTTTNNTRHIDSAETAKLAIKALAQVFPGVKFSRKTSRYSGGSSVDIGWDDGPTTSQVEEVVGHMKGATFDSMTDCKNYHNTEEIVGLTRQGDVLTETVSYGNDYIFCNREYSPDAAQLAFNALKSDDRPTLTRCGYVTIGADATLTVTHTKYLRSWDVRNADGTPIFDADLAIREWLSHHDLRDMANPVKIDRYA